MTKKIVRTVLPIAPSTYDPVYVNQLARALDRLIDEVRSANINFQGVGGQGSSNALQEGDIFVGDAFSCAHRAHASTEGVAHLLPSFAGDTLAAEVQALQTVLETPKRPVAAVVGGAKISTKLAVLEHLIERVDHLILGGGMSNIDRLYKNIPPLIPKYTFSNKVITKVLKNFHGDSSGVRGAAWL